MAKKIFPKGKNKKTLENIGIPARLMIVRRGFNAFVVTLLIEFGIATALWWAHNEDVSNMDTAERTYDFTHSNEFICISTIFLGIALAIGSARRKIDMESAKNAEHFILGELNDEYETDKVHFYDGLLDKNPGGIAEWSYAAPEWRLSPVEFQVLKNMASMYPKLFERLLSGETNPGLHDYAVAVISGYLKTHPDEFHRVQDVYDAQPLPRSLIRKYAGCASSVSKRQYNAGTAASCHKGANASPVFKEQSLKNSRGR